MAPAANEEVVWRRQTNGSPEIVRRISAYVAEVSPRGMVFERITNMPGSWGEGYLTRHGLAIHLSSAKQSFYIQGLGRRSYRCRPGTLQFWPAFKPFAVAWDEPHEVLALAIEPEFYGRFVEPAGAIQELQENLDFSDPIIEQVLFALDVERREGNPCGKIYTESLTAAVLARLLRRQTNGGLSALEPRSTATLSAKSKDQVLDYIEANLHRPIRLAELSDMLEMNFMNLLKRFKVALGEPPYRYILKRRISRAKQMLVTTDLPIAEIALRCGFSEQSSFTRAFRRVVGVPPSAFRRRG